MTVDILSRLNTGGSGLDLVSLSRDLAEATYAPRQGLVSARIDRAEVSLSALDRVSAQMAQLSETLGIAGRIETRQVSSSQAGVGVTMTDPALAPDVPVEIEVLSLAQSQVLEFRGFAGPDAPLGGGALIVDIGSWTGEPPVFSADPARSGARLEIPAGATLQEVAETLSQLEGVTARPLAVGDGTWSLGVVSETGAANALRFTADAGASADIAALDFSADPTAVERRIAVNALVTVDGIPVGRPTNRIDDLVPGLSLTLNDLTTTPSLVQVRPDTETATQVMQGVVEELNALKSLMRQVTARGIDGAEPGELAGDAAMQSLARELDGMLAGGLPGFGDRPVFLAELGIRTERDGTLSFDSDAFEAAFEADPSRLASVLEDTLSGTGPGVAFAGMPGPDATPGRYDFRRDPATGEAWLGGIALTPRPLEDGRTAYAVPSGPLSGIEVIVEDGVSATSVDFGRSLASRLSDWIDAASAGDGAIGRRQSQLSDEIFAGSETLETLSGQAEDYESRMRTRFTEMERIITQLNATGDYIQNLIDGFNAQNN
ncbi:flagellar filament capping protein FliD [Roseicyclus sp.]